MYRKEVIGISSARKFHASCFVGSIYHRKSPLKTISFIKSVITVILGHHWCIYSMSINIFLLYILLLHVMLRGLRLYGETYRNILITYGIGMVITTSSSSRCSTPCSSSYSIFTSHPPCPFSEGQQLTTFVNKFKLILDYRPSI